MVSNNQLCVCKPQGRKLKEEVGCSKYSCNQLTIDTIWLLKFAISRLIFFRENNDYNVRKYPLLFLLVNKSQDTMLKS